jgi:hypothetical protein
MGEGLAPRLIRTWEDQIQAGFILGDPHAPVETRLVPDPESGVTFRLRWLPHRELRTDTRALERKGILQPDRDEAALSRDPRDPSGRHCFLCPANVRICHPREKLVPIRAGGRDWFAGANFAWLAENHFTVMADEHVDQSFDISVVDAMLDLQDQTAGAFRLVYNGSHAGATIPWHLHLQVTTDAFPVEEIASAKVSAYPTPLLLMEGPRSIDVADYVTAWQERDPQHHRVNLLATLREGRPAVFVFLRDTRFTIAGNKGLMGGWEVAGDFAYSDRRSDFNAADIEAVRSAYAAIRPPAFDPDRRR